MTSQTEIEEISTCLHLIEQKIGWGSCANWATQDFGRLSEMIATETGVSLSVSTLKRIWGKVKYDSAPTLSTLNALATFLGYENWHVYKQQIRAKPVADILSLREEVNIEVPLTPKNYITGKQRWLVLGSLILITSAIIGFSKLTGKSQSIPRDFAFSSRPISRSIPNSVVFTYDASASPVDSIYIQQSWDSTRRIAVAKDGRSHTAIYYEPGYFQAKLVAGSRVLKEHPLIVPTEGWLGLISTTGVPVYLKTSEFVAKDMLSLSTNTIHDYKIALQPAAPIIKYFNVGNFKPVSLGNFSFTTKVRQQYNEGAAACQFSWVVLMTNGMPVVIQLSQKGCVSDLNLMDGSQMVSGKTNDLSAFGVDFSEWIQVDCRSDGKNIDYLVNGHLAYSSTLPKENINIVGVVYGFQGTGAVKEIKLYNDSKLAFEAF